LQMEAVSGRKRRSRISLRKKSNFLFRFPRLWHRAGVPAISFNAAPAGSRCCGADGSSCGLVEEHQCRSKLGPEQMQKIQGESKICHE
jgi:hypothetical protein